MELILLLIDACILAITLGIVLCKYQELKERMNDYETKYEISQRAFYQLQQSFADLMIFYRKEKDDA